MTVVELFDISAERVERARQTFDTARTTLANAKAFGTVGHVSGAAKALAYAAEIYTSALQTHAGLVTQVAKNGEGPE